MVSSCRGGGGGGGGGGNGGINQETPRRPLADLAR